MINMNVIKTTLATCPGSSSWDSWSVGYLAFEEVDGVSTNPCTTLIGPRYEPFKYGGLYGLLDMIGPYCKVVTNVQWKPKDPLTISGVGKCPVLGILNITFKYLLVIISPIVGWCSIRTFTNPCISHSNFHHNCFGTSKKPSLFATPPAWNALKGLHRPPCQDWSILGMSKCLAPQWRHWAINWWRKKKDGIYGNTLHF